MRPIALILFSFFYTTLFAQVTGTISDADGNPIAGASILAQNFSESLEFQAADDGSFDINLPSSSYTLYIGAWGYHELEASYTTSSGLDFVLERGYKDDFILDQGWTVTGDAETGIWERAEPSGTEYNNWPCNPEGDDPTDSFGNQAIVSGNGGGNAGFDDVDNGTSIITSQAMDLSDLPNPRISFTCWFFNDGGNNAEPNDNITVVLDNGSESKEVAIYKNSLPVWFPREVDPSEHFDDLSNLTISFEISDFQGTGHLVEGGIDQFLVYEGVSSNQNVLALDVKMGPVPFEHELFIDIQSPVAEKLQIINQQGKICLEHKITDKQTLLNTSALPPGTYYAQFSNKKQLSKPVVIIKI